MVHVICADDLMISPFFCRYMVKQEAAALAATQVAFVLQSGQHRGLQFAVASGPPGTTSQQETA